MNYIYLHGFASSSASTKARFFRQRFEDLGVELKVPELAPDFENLTITSQIGIVGAEAAPGPLTLIGSSMGGYVAALYASTHAEVERLVLLAPAFGLSDRWAETLGGERVDQWRSTGFLEVFHYASGEPRRLSYRMAEDAAHYGGYPQIHCPALILHGIHDTVVPVEHSRQFARLTPSAKLVEFHSGHELTDVLEALWKETAAFLDLSVPGGNFQKS